MFGYPVTRRHRVRLAQRAASATAPDLDFLPSTAATWQKIEVGGYLLILWGMAVLQWAGRAKARGETTIEALFGAFETETWIKQVQKKAA